MFVDQDEDIENFKISLAGEYKSFLNNNSINCKIEKEIKNQELNSTKSGTSSKNQGIIKEKNIREFIEHHLGLQPYSSAEIDKNRKMSVYKLTAVISNKHKNFCKLQQPDLIDIYKFDDPVEKMTKLKSFQTHSNQYSYSITKNSISHPEEYNLKLTKGSINKNQNQNVSIKCGSSHRFEDAVLVFFSDEKQLTIQIYINSSKNKY